MYYYDFVLKERGDEKPLNRKFDKREKLWKIPAASPRHALERWLCSKTIHHAALVSLETLREYQLIDRRGRTIAQYRHVRDYDRDDIYKL